MHKLRPIHMLTVTAIACAVTGCATSSSLTQFYDPEIPGLAQTRIQTKYVRTIDGDWNEKNSARMRQTLVRNGYWYIGTLEFVGPMQEQNSISQFAASMGADLVIRRSQFVGMKKGSRMVVGSYTPGRVVTSTQSGYANAYSSGSGNIYGNYGALNYNDRGTASAYGSSSSTTYIPGQTTYVRESFEYPAYFQRYTLMQSESQFRKNAPNFRKYLKATRGKIFTDDEYAIFVDEMVDRGKQRDVSKEE